MILMLYVWIRVVFRIFYDTLYKYICTYISTSRSPDIAFRTLVSSNRLFHGLVLSLSYHTVTVE